MRVAIYFDRLQCLEPTRETGGDRDEVYIIVTADSSQDLYYRRLPAADDYYEFVTGHTGKADDHTTWTNQDQLFVGRPLLWTGTLNNNEGANLFVVIAEQDNADLGPLRQALEAGLGVGEPLITHGENQPPAEGEGGSSLPLASAAVNAARALISAIPNITSHDVIGALAIHVRNEGGLQYAIVPWEGYKFGAGRPGATATTDGQSYYAARITSDRQRAMTFTFDAAQQEGETPQGRYVGVIMIRVVDAFGDLERIQYLGREADACGQPILRVRGRDRIVEVPKGAKDVRVDVASREFFWDCGSDTTNDRTNGPEVPTWSLSPARRQEYPKGPDI